MKKILILLLSIGIIGLVASCDTEEVNPKPKPPQQDNINKTWKLNQSHTKGKWIGSQSVANVAYAKSQTGDTWKKVYIDNPVKYGLFMYQKQGDLVVQFNDSTYYKHGGHGTLQYSLRVDSLFGTSVQINSYGRGSIRQKGDGYLYTMIHFTFNCSKISQYHSQSKWKIYHVSNSNKSDTTKVFVFTKGIYCL